MDSVANGAFVPKNIIPKFQYIFAFFLIVLAYWGVTTNSDWVGYEYWFDVDASGTDKAFAFLSAWFNERGLSFRMLYRFHILLIAFFYVVLFRKLRVNPILYSVILLLFSYDAVGNQIRYFVGLPMALLAIHYYVYKKYIWAVILGVLAFFFHSSLFLFFAIFFLYYHLISRVGITWELVLIIVFNILLYYVLHETGMSSKISGNYDTYITSSSRVSSVLGGIYNLFTTITYIYFAFIINREVKIAEPTLTMAIEYKYLYSCIMMGTVLVLCSIPTQIIAHRMMSMAMMPIWLTFFLRTYKLNIKNIKGYVKICLIVIFLFNVLHSLGVFTGSDSYIYHVKEMLNSYSFD